MSFVLDASVTASWYLPDEQHVAALAVRQKFASERAYVPQHWWFEIRNTLLMAERRGRTTGELTRAALANLARLPVIETLRPDDHAVFALARRHALTFYDATYLELARRERVALATLDDRLADAAGREGVQVLPD
jgi:predicted nucleic acid-binding protein